MVRAARDGAFAQIVELDDKIVKLEAANKKLCLELDALRAKGASNPFGGKTGNAFGQASGL